MTAALRPPRATAVASTTTWAGTAPRSPVLAAALLGLGVLCGLLAVVPGVVDGLDGQSMLQVTHAIVRQGDVTVTAPIYGVPGLHGHSYSKYGPGQSLLAIPLYLAGQALAQLIPPSYRPEVPDMAASLLPAIATAVTAALLVLTAIELGAAARGALILALVYAFATPAITYAGQWFSEPLVSCSVLAALYLLLRDRYRDHATPWRLLLAGVALSVAVSTRLDSLLFVPPLALYALLPAGQRGVRAMALLAPLAVALLGMGFYDAARFGSPLETGYSKGNAFAILDTHPPHTLASFLQGLYGLLLSPGKGLVEYAPIVLLAPLGATQLWTRRRTETALLLALIALDLVAHANVLIHWLGGWSWGPRFLMPVVPLVVLLLAPLLDPAEDHGRRTRYALAGLAVVGALVQAPALLVHQPVAYLNTLAPVYDARFPHHHLRADTHMEADYVNLPALSPIVGSWRMLGRTATWTEPPDVSPAAVARKSITVAPHTWWWLLALQGVPPLPIGIALGLLLAAAGACLNRAVRMAPPEPGSPP